MTKKPGRAQRIARQKRNASRRRKFSRQERDGARSADRQLERSEFSFEPLEKKPQGSGALADT